MYWYYLSEWGKVGFWALELGLLLSESVAWMQIPSAVNIFLWQALILRIEIDKAVVVDNTYRADQWYLFAIDALLVMKCSKDFNLRIDKFKSDS